VTVLTFNSPSLGCIFRVELPAALAAKLGRLKAVAFMIFLMVAKAALVAVQNS